MRGVKKLIINSIRVKWGKQLRELLIYLLNDSFKVAPSVCRQRVCRKKEWQLPAGLEKRRVARQTSNNVINRHKRVTHKTLDRKYYSLLQ
jgi:hypothetical protein